MKRTVLLALLALALPLSASAGSILDFETAGGTLSGTVAGLSLSSELTVIHILNCSGRREICFIPASGPVSFTTGAFSGTSLASAGTFRNGTFSFTDNGSVIFSGTFSNITWTPVGGGGILSGTVSFSFRKYGDFLGVSRFGSAQISIASLVTNGNVITGTIGDGNTIFSPVPEPATLGMFVTGLAGIAGMVWKKLKV